MRNYNLSLDTVIFKTKQVKKLSHHIDKRFNLIHDLDLIIRLSKISELTIVLLYYPIGEYIVQVVIMPFKNSHPKKKFEKKIINIYPKDKKLKFCLNNFTQKRLYEEFIGCIINDKIFNAKNIINNINNKRYKIIF